MNINNGKTGIIDIPGALHSTGGDGDGQIGGVVAYTGDIWDETQGKNQAKINASTLGKINDLQTQINNVNTSNFYTKSEIDAQNVVTSTALNDLSDRVDTNESAINDLNDNVDSLQETVNSKLALDNNNNLLINSKSEVESTATNSLIGGIATVGKGEYSIAFAGNAQSVYISGNASDGYQLQINTTSSFNPTNWIRPIFENIYKNTYLLDANTYEKVAKITAVTPNVDD